MIFEDARINTNNRMQPELCKSIVNQSIVHLNSLLFTAFIICDELELLLISNAVRKQFYVQCRYVINCSLSVCFII